MSKRSLEAPAQAKTRDALRGRLETAAGLVHRYDTIAEWLDDALAERLAAVPEERIVTPPVQLAGPLLEVMRFTTPDSPVRALLANLLAAAMDAMREHLAHVAFVDVLRQIGPDEGRILKALADHVGHPVIDVVRTPTFGRSSFGHQVLLRNFTTLPYDAACESPESGPRYLDNLARLGVVSLHPNLSIATEGAYDAVRAHPVVVETVARAQEAGDRTNIVEKTLRVTGYGTHLCAACVLSQP
jgi:hypothetical protein